jgi:hypothetical protein
MNFTMNDRVYESAPAREGVDMCEGCAFAGPIHDPGCARTPDCEDIIFVRAGERPAQTESKPMLLSADPTERKAMPITTGVLDYFPLAMAEVAKVSKAGNDQHNPGQPLHWDKTKSLDHADCISRHLIDRGSRDTDGMRHSAKLVWRALALLQTELEAAAELPQ